MEQKPEGKEEKEEEKEEYFIEKIPFLMQANPPLPIQKKDSNSQSQELSNKRKPNIEKKFHQKGKPINEVINLLLELDCIKILPSFVIREIYKSITEHHYRIHQTVLNQGDPIDNLYIIKSGSFLLTINHESIAQVSQDIYSFIHYQAITQEPFVEKRRYELTGKISNKEQIPIFIYQKRKFFGDIEIISGRDKSLFNIIANEEKSSLYVIDRIKWVKLTKRVRVMFTRLTLNKIKMIYDRILNVLKGKDYLNIDKMRSYKKKIYEQITVNNNYEIYYNRIEKKEKKLKDEINKFKSNNLYSKEEKEKSKSLINFQQNKDYLLNLFKFPNIIKEHIKFDLDKYLFKIKEKDIRRFKLGKTISKFSQEKDSSRDDISSKNENKNLNSNLFITNSLKNMKNNSANNIFDAAKTIDIINTKKIRNMVFMAGNNSFKSSIINNNSNDPTLSNIYKTFESINKISGKKLSSLKEMKKSAEINNQKYNVNDIYNSQKIQNWVLNSIINKDNINKNKKVMVKPLKPKGRNKIINRNKTMKIYSENKKEKMTQEQINLTLKQRYISTKEHLIDKLLGKKEREKTIDINNNINKDLNDSDT